MYISFLGAILVAIQVFLNSLALILVKEVTPYIPKFYRLFEAISNFEFLDDAYLNRIWNNIYIFVAVIVLFAIAIKLIAAMVNPDTLSDSKKGVKAYYFRTVIAVVLIFLIPLLFDYSFELQSDLSKKNFLMSHVFGYKIKNGMNAGQLLAWESFSAFIYPVDIDKLDNASYNSYVDVQNEATKYHITVLFNNMTATDEPADKIKTEDLAYAYRTHNILCCITVLLVAYEMILLCMDTFFRSAKLGFLEMMTPMVLGAYVFNPEILKKWAKEFFSTYISLFLKMLALAFMIISISQAKEKMAGMTTFNDDKLLSGLFSIILIISLLQLIKKIPELINGIFGTNIKFGGGIKGRLGEMAGIGGLAQQAWASLGKTAKNVGKLGLGVPAVIGYGVADAFYHKKTGERLKDNAWFKRGKGALYAGRAALKSGSWLDAAKEYNQIQAIDNLSASDARGISKRTSDNLKKYGVVNGTYSATDDSNNFKSAAQREKDLQGVMSETKNFTGANKRKFDTSIRNYGQALQKNADLKELQTLQNKESDRMQAIASEVSSRTDFNEAQKLRMNQIAATTAQGKKVTKEDMQYIASNGFVSAEALQKDANDQLKYETLLKYVSDNYNIPIEELRKGPKMTAIVNKSETEVGSLKQVVEDLKQESVTSAGDKIRVTQMMSAMEQIAGGHGLSVEGMRTNEDGKAVSLDDDAEWLRATTDAAGNDTSERTRIINEAAAQYVPSDTLHGNEPQEAPQVSSIVDANGNPIPIPDNSPVETAEPVAEEAPVEEAPTTEEPVTEEPTSDESSVAEEIEKLNSEKSGLMAEREEISSKYPVDEKALAEIDEYIAEIDRKISELS